MAKHSIVFWADSSAALEFGYDAAEKRHGAARRLAVAGHVYADLEQQLEGQRGEAGIFHRFAHKA